MAALKSSWFSTTRTLASYKLVSYKKKCILQYAIKRLTDLLNIVLTRDGKENFPLLILRIKIKFTIEYSMINLIKKLVEFWVNNCMTFLFFKICMCLIHVNTSTPSLLDLTTVETHNGTNDQLMLCFA